MKLRRKYNILKNNFQVLKVKLAMKNKIIRIKLKIWKQIIKYNAINFLKKFTN